MSKKGTKPHLIPFSDKDIEFIKNTLETDNSKIVTEKHWNFIKHELKLKSTQTFCRRATNAKFNIKLGYEFKEYDCNIHSKKRYLQIRCIHCNVIYVGLAGIFLKRKYYVEACPKCYVKFYQRDKEWIDNQRIKQRIAQHKPETKLKHIQNSKNSWLKTREKRIESMKRTSTKEVHEKIRISMKKRWAEDEDYRNRVNGKGKFKHCGKFEAIVYDSKLELAFLIWCEKNNKHVEKAKFYVKYIDPNDGKEHDYYPDFILEHSTIVEVKGRRWIEMQPLVFVAKVIALSNYCHENNKNFRLVYDNDLKDLYKEAKIYHETQKKNSNSL